MPKAGTNGLLAASILLILTQATATAADPPRLTRPAHATKLDVDPGRTYSAPVLLVHPNNSRVLASYVEMRSRKCGLLVSNDAGQSWTRRDNLPGLNNYPFCFTANGSVAQTPIAFGRDGRLYYALAGWDVQDGAGTGTVSVQLARSEDVGENWQTTLVRNARGTAGNDTENNRPVQGLAVDTKRGKEDIVYVAWRQNHSIAQAPNAVPEFPTVAVSRDGGRTFDEPINLSKGVYTEGLIAEALKTTTTTAGPTTTTTAPEQPPVTTPASPATTVPAAPPAAAGDPARPTNFGGGNPHVTLDDKGNVYIVWPSRNRNITGGVGPAVFLSKSTDQGRSFTTTQIAPFRWGNPGFGNVFIAWSPKGGSQGSLHLVQEGTDRPEIRNELDVLYRRSLDGGKTWSEPKVLNDDDPAKVYFQFDPNLRIAPDGRIDVVWWDTRDDPGTRANDVYYTYSTDNGVTWAKNIRITDQSVNRKIGVWGNNFNVDSQPGLASTGRVALIGWDDTRNTDTSAPVNTQLGGGVQDIYVNAVQFAALGGGVSRTAKIVLAGVVGLFVVGLVLLVMALLSRRRGAPPPERKRVGREPAGVA
ncbi:MAG: glycoside hydrolase [Actinobacteria bacterium]|nr:glycoside hydrolase [Actinomycetota bacterium]